MTGERSAEPPETAAGALAELRAARAALADTARRMGGERWGRLRPVLDVAGFCVFVVAMTMLVSRIGSGTVQLPPADSIAEQSIRAERDLLVEDRRSTDRLRAEAAAAVPRVYDHDSELYFALGDRVMSAIDLMVKRRDEGRLETAARQVAFETDLGQSVEAETFRALESLPEPADAGIALVFFLNMALDRMVVADRAVLPRGEPILVRDRRTEALNRLEHLGGILELRQLQRVMTVRGGDAPYASARPLRGWILATARSLARPNLVANPVATESARQAAVAGVEPVFVRIRSGEVLVRRGDRVSQQAHERIRLMNEDAGNRARWREVGAAATLIGGTTLLGFAVFRRRQLPTGPRKAAWLSLAAALLGAAGGLVVYYAARGVADGLGIEPEVAVYAMPVALAPLLVALMVQLRVALLVAALLPLFIAHRVDGGLAMVTVFTIGGMVAALAGARCRSRTHLLRAGFAVGAVQAAVVPLALSFSGTTLAMPQLPIMTAALVAGIVAAALALVVVPLLEYLFDEATELRLVELAASDSPLLKRLALVAPGSYYASVVVGNLAEAAAEAVGADPTRCRVMALYHDIGKVERPSYFSENQRDGNVHDRLPPEVSARIVFAHVKDGLDLARRHRLPGVIVEGIACHQGTALLRPFFVKALAQAKSGGPVPAEEDYRYPGPLPSSREAGILMLADAVEAGCRALASPRPADLRQRVTEIFEEKARDGQLDRSSLSLGELGSIRDAFLRVLTLGIYHSRIEYPPLPAAADGMDDDGHRRLGYLGRLVDRAS